MKSLDKQQVKRLQALTATLHEKADALLEQIGVFNTAMQGHRQAVEKALEDYNATLEEAEQFREEVHADMETYWDERSEKWQEGDAGSDYSDWKDSWSQTLDAVEIDFPEDLDEPELTHAEDLESLGTEV